MRSSSIFALLGASLAVASPLAHNHMHKKAIVYDIVTDIVYVTVTEGELPSTKPPHTVKVQHTVYVNPVEASPSSSSTVKPTTSEAPSSTYVPPPPPSTTTTPPPAPPATEAPAPTTTTEAPAPAIEAAPVEPTTEAAAPVVQVAASSDAPVAVATTAPATSGNSLASTGVDKHNTCRSSHSAENVSWNETLASYAAKTAATCVFAHDMTEGGGRYGQNIASQGSSSADAWTLESALENAIISEWYSEQSLFAGLYGVESPQESSAGQFLHFTQIVWKNSLEIGCAVQACPTSNSIFPGMYTWFTVCNYYPQGNVMGTFAENVAAS